MHGRGGGWVFALGLLWRYHISGGSILRAYAKSRGGGETTEMRFLRPFLGNSEASTNKYCYKKTKTEWMMEEKQKCVNEWHNDVKGCLLKCLRCILLSLYWETRTLETKEKDGHNTFRLRTDGDLIPESALEEEGRMYRPSDWKIKYYFGFKVLVALLWSFITFWNVTSCSLLETLFEAYFLLDTFLAYSSTLKIDAVYCPEISANFYRTTLQHIPEDSKYSQIYYFLRTE
jgi:hypothetical protein